MATRARSRRQELSWFGLRPETVHEIAGIFLFLVGLACLLAVVSLGRNENLIGPVGLAVANGLQFTFGTVVSYLLPSMVIAFGVGVFRGFKLKHPLAFILGFILIILATSGLCAHSVAHWGGDETASFAWGGAVGKFLLHEHGAAMEFWLGTAGTYVALIGAAAIGLLLTTNFLFAPLFKRLGILMTAIGRATGRLFSMISIPKPRFSIGRDTRYFGTERHANPRALEAPAQELTERARKALVIDGEPLDYDYKEAEPIEEYDPEPEEPQIEFTTARRQSSSRAANQKSAAGQLVQEEFEVFQGYQLPPLELLSDSPENEERMSNRELMELSDQLEKVLSEFNIGARVVKVTQGPTVTMFELQTAPGVKVSRISSLESDIAMALKAISVRILAPVPGRGTVGIEVPNTKPSIVFLKDILVSDKFQNLHKPLAFALGKSVQGEPMVCDLARMPHLLIAGATGSGKSVCLNSIICSLLIRQSPNRLKFLMIDPKKVELNVYQDVPHLLAPVVSEPRKAAAALAWVVSEMEDRYERLRLVGEKNIDAYNKVATGEKEFHSLAVENERPVTYMPHIVVVIDELADLMLMCRKEVEENVARLAQMSRAVGIHLILATQRPSVNVITGIIKANFPTRIAFQVASQVDSKTILDGKGAEALLGQGDMLFLGGNQRKPVRVQGTFVSDHEVEDLTNFIRGQECVQYVADDFQPLPEEQDGGVALDEEDSGSYGEPADSGDEDYEEYESSSTIDDAGDLDRPRIKTTHYMVDDFETPDNPDDELEDELYHDALRLILTSKKASVSLIQRKLKIGYARAGRLMDIMENKGIVGPYCGSKPREFLIDPEPYYKRLKQEGVL